MFEKEAHEFQKQIQQEYLDLAKNGAYPPLWERKGELWRKGAEFGYNKAKEELTERLAYAKSIIQDLLNNSDEYAKQRARDFLEEK